MRYVIRDSIPSAQERNPTNSIWSWLFWLPVQIRHQIIFAEAFSQTLTAGLETSEAVLLAASAIPSRRFRAALHAMAKNCRSGYSLSASLSKTGIAVCNEMIAALQRGEERGKLTGEMSAFALEYSPNPGGLLGRALGRKKEVTEFATALAWMLQEHKLTIGLIEDAARLVANQGLPFSKAMARVIDAVRGGEAFAVALATEKTVFDSFFCTLVGMQDDRPHLRSVLARLGGQTPDSLTLQL